MDSLGIEYAGVAVRVESAEPDDLVWLSEFLCPPFDASAGDPDGWAVRLLVSPAAHAALESAGPQPNAAPAAVFGFDTQVVRLPLWNGRPGETTVRDAEAGTFCSVLQDARRVTLLAPAPSPLVRLFLMRVVREIAMDALRRQGRLVLHAAALELHGRGLAIVGAKGAGKTTLLARLLREPGARYVSNDRVVVGLDGDGAPTVRGMTSLVMLREATLGLLPGLRARFDDHVHGAFLSRAGTLAAARGSARPVLRDGRYALSPGAFCALLGAGRIGQARLESIVFPRVVPELVGFELRRTEPAAAAALLRASRFGRDAPLEGPTLFGDGREPSAEPQAVERLWEALASRTTGFECRVGRELLESRESGAELLRRLTGA